MKTVKRVLKLFGVAALALILLFIVALELPFLWAGGSAARLEYADWMKETLTGPERLTDIAMLGAHDALTADMTLSSKVDDASVASPFQLWICKSLGYRQSKTQLSGVTDLLNGGVRYFDIRVTRDAESGEFYTVHNYYGAPLAEYLAAFTAFLREHPGEVLVLDFQHCYDITQPDKLLGEAHFEELYTLLLKSGLLAYAQAPSLATATYGEVTENKSRAACLILMKHTGGRQELLDYEGSIVSPWFNTDSAQEVFSGLDAAATEDACGGYGDRFRVQQGVLTMQASPAGIWKAIGSWSLLRRAEGFNAAFSHRQNDAWLAAMPIVMTDHTLSDTDGAYTRLMEMILQYNEKLA